MKKTLIALSLLAIVGCSQQTSDEHIVSAREYLAQDQVEAAIVELKNAVQKDPASAEARFELGKVYLETKDFESAEKELNRALENGYSPTEVIPLLSKAYKRTGAYAALSEIDHAEAGLSDTEAAEVGFSKLQSLVQLNKIDEARALIEELEQLDTRSVYKGLVSVFTPILNQDYPMALLKLEELKKQSPLNADILSLQGRLLLLQNETPDAVEVYQEYVTEYPDDKQTQFVLAKLLVDNGKIDEAEPHVDELLKISPENALLNQLKATTSAAKQNFPDALRHAEKAIQNGRGDPTLRLIAGFAGYQLQDYETSARHLSYVASSLPDNHPGLKMLAASQLQLGQSSEAGNVLDRLNQVSESDALLFTKTGYELIRSGNLKQAEEVVKRTNDISRTAEDFTRLGVLKLSLNDLEGIVNLEQAVEQAPEMQSANSTLATAYLATKQWEKAKELAKQWKQVVPEAIEPYMLEGEVLVNEQNYAGAKEQFSKVVEMEPANGLAKLALANIELLQGNNEEGIAAIESILAEKGDFEPALGGYYIAKKRIGQGQDGIQPSVDALAKAPNNLSLRGLVARMYMSEKQYGKALEVLELVIADASAPDFYWNIRGQALLRTNQLERAEEHYETWLGLSPNNKQAELGKLLILDHQRKFAEGLESVKSFLEIRDDEQLRVLYTHFLIMTGDKDLGRAEMEKLSEGVMQLPMAKAFQSRLLLMEEKPQEALPLAKAAYAAVSNTRNLVLLLSSMELVGQRPAGVELLTNHVEKHPEDVAAKMLLAERQIANSQSDAIATYEQSLKLNPDNFVVLNNLAYLYFEAGRIADAKKLANRAVELRPENPAALDTLAQILVAEEDYDEALKYYERAVDDNMRNEEIYLNYVETLLLADQTRLAQRKLEQREMASDVSKQRVAELKSKFGI